MLDDQSSKFWRCDTRALRFMIPSDASPMLSSDKKHEEDWKHQFHFILYVSYQLVSRHHDDSGCGETPKASLIGLWYLAVLCRAFSIMVSSQYSRLVVLIVCVLICVNGDVSIYYITLLFYSVDIVCSGSISPSSLSVM